MGPTVEFNHKGIILTQIRDRQLLYGYEVTPLIITDTSAHPAAAGNCFYQFRCLGSTNAVIASALDLDGAAVSGLAGVTITAADQPYNIRLSSITLTSGKIIVYSKLLQDL